MSGIGGFFGGAGTTPAVAPSYTGLQVQTAVNALPIPIVYGASKLAPNLIWYNHFVPIAQTSGSGGKGGSSTLSAGGSHGLSRSPRSPRHAGMFVSTVFVTTVVAVFVYFFPVWTGAPLSPAGFRDRMWLHGPGLANWI